MNGHGDDADEQLRRIYEDARLLARQPIVASGGRGDFRFPDTKDRKTELSVELLAAFLQGHRIETVLQRTIVEIMHERPHACWFNEFNVAAGCAGGGNAYNRHAVDLGRVSPVDPMLKRYDLDLFELKQWRNDLENPEFAARELFTVFAAYWHLVLRGEDPYVDARNQVNCVRLAVMAPASYFRSHGAALDRLAAPLNRLLLLFHQSLNRLKQLYGELCPVEFHPHAVVLSDELAEEDFRDFFDQERIHEHIREDRPCDCPTNVL